MEYPWNREHHFVRSQLADNYIREFQGIARLFSDKFLDSKGDENQWTYEYELSDEIETGKVLNMIRNELTKREIWEELSFDGDHLSGTLSNSVLGDGILDIKINGSNQLILHARRKHPMK